MPADPHDDFSGRLREALKERGMTQARLAATVGVSENTVSNWTCGRYRPAYVHVRLIADSLGLSTNALLDESSNASDAELAADREANEIVASLAALKLEATLGDLVAGVPDLISVLRRAQQHRAGDRRPAIPG